MLLNINQLNDRVGVDTRGKGAVLVSIRALSTWTSATLALKRRVGGHHGGGGFGDFTSAVAITSADAGKTLGPYLCTGADEVALEVTAVETSGASPSGIYLDVNIAAVEA